MFRAAAAGPFDEVVTKATDENLTSEDWGAIIEVCDKVSGDQNGSKEAVQSMIKRLAHRNANVQLYTLEVRSSFIPPLDRLVTAVFGSPSPTNASRHQLAHALCQNCGKQMHREISSRAFTEALLKLANDRNTHQQVKSKILEKMQEWSDMFSSDADLGIMHDAFHRLKQSNPTLQPPSAPQKQGLTDQDRQKEDDELQMALKLSLQDEERKKTAQAAPASQAGPNGQQQQQGAPVSTAVPSGTTAATVSRVRALFDFVPSEPGELEFKKGDVIAVLESVYKDWWRGSLKGKTGIFPLNYVEKLTDPTPEEMQREAQMEAEVFAEIKNVEKLLTLLSASNTGPREEDNEEISTLAIRPKLIKLIEKYSQKKDDFTQLNEKFIKARRDYESLLESSMSHPPQHNYQQYAMRPAPQAYPPAGGNYPPPQQQDVQRFYAPSPQGSEASSHAAAGQPPAAHQYPPRDNAPRIPAANGNNQPPPLKTKTSSSPAPPQNFNPFPQPASQPPPSTYGAQELATSVYDSPIAPNNPSSAVTYSSSVYSQDGPPIPHPNDNDPMAPYATTQQPSYQSYQPPQQPPPAPPGQPSQRPPNVMTPSPLQPSGSAYDARQSLPSQSGAGAGPQYRPYVPPGSSEPSAPAPNDYYRQPGVY
ncbi:hypothetical protein Trco_005016 [Trichoderma cornu-damae]|uniref:Class E vacuolar protein-sorting machinery protein HSE1 n=1 Tax=Trichoderma cornu-damae TaxID=654480 RepID=A0A9P8QNF0_9HYPO|nr:hypothetical protein Trco_005016 [Trichoderma cornu-damae]